MINDLDMQNWAYLLSPTFQQVNSAGKPLTDGYLEVYIHGTRNKYYCASDFNGTLHPFQIKLDSLGSNIVLADPSQSYDVYVYNKFGSLVMSRYNVIPVNGGDGSSALNITIESTDGTIEVNSVSAGNFDLAISDSVMYRIESLEDAINNLDTTSAYAIGHADSDNGSVFTITNDGVSGIDYLSDMTGYRLKPGHVYQFNYNASFDCGEHNRYVDGKFYLEGVDTIAQDWNFSVDDSYNHDESFNGSTILVTPTNLDYYDVKLKYQLNDTYANAPDINLNKISIVDITSILQSNAGSASGVEYVGGNGIVINNDNHVISVDMDYISSHLSVDIDAKVASAINVANNYTDARVTAVSGDLVELISQVSGSNVQSDWEQTDSDEPDYIKNKPNLNNYATKNELITVSGVLQDEIDAIDIPDVSQFATHTEVNSVSSVLETEIQIVSAAIGEQVPNVSIQSPSGSLVITETVSGNNKIYSIDVAPTSGIEYGTFYGTDISGAATLYRTKGNINVNNGKIQLKKGQSYHITVRGRYNQSTLVPETGIVSYIEYITNNSINFNVDKSISDSQYFEISYDLFNLNNDVDYYVFFTLSNAKVNDLFIDVHSLVGAGSNGSGGGGGAEYDAGWGINILNNVISVDPSILDNYVTINEFNTTIDVVTGMIPDVSDFVDSETVSAIVEAATANIPSFQQVNSDWTATSGVAEILNKPIESELIAGDGITISASGNDYVISASVTGIEGYVTESELATVSGNIVNQIPAAQIQSDWNQTNASAKDYIKNKPNIPAAQVQSNWTETNTSSKAYIQNKPSEYDLVAGSNVTITVSGNDLVISAAGGSAGDVTRAELISVSGTLQNEIETVSGSIPDVSNFIPYSASGVELPNSKFKIDTNGQAYKLDNSTQTITGTYGSHDIEGQVWHYSTFNGIQNGVEYTLELPSNQYDHIKVYTVPGGDWYNVHTLYTSDSPSDNAFKFTLSNYDSTEGNLYVSLYYYDPPPGADDWVFYKQALTLSSGNLSEIKYITEVELDAVSAQIPDVSNLATKSEVQAVANDVQIVSGAIPDISGLATKQELNVVSGMIPDVSDFVTETTLETVSGNIVNQIPDVSNYATTQALESASGALNNKIDAVSGAIPDVSNFATETELQTVSGTIVGMIPDVSDLATKQEVATVSGMIPDVSNLASKSELNSVSGTLQAEIISVSSSIPSATTYTGVSGVIVEDDNIGLDDPIFVVAGSGINLSQDGDNIVISCTVTGGGGGSTYTAGDHIDITNDTISVTGITELVAGNAITISTSGASAIISSTGEAQVQSDWDVNDPSSKAYIKNKPYIQTPVQSNWAETNSWDLSYIQNKPTIHTYTAASGINITNDVVSLDNPIGLVAGNNVTIEVSGSSAIISAQVSGGGSSYSAGNGIDITNNTISVDTTIIPDVSAVSAMIDAASANGNLFIATYDRTPFNDVDTAYKAGKFIVLQDTSSKSTNNGFAPLSKFDSSTNRYYFTKPLQFTAGSNIYNRGVTTSWVKSSGGWDGWYTGLGPNWNETNTNSLSYIANKPDLSVYATTTTLNSVSGTLETEIQAVSSAIPTVTLQSLNTANITDIQLVDAASACTGANILYLIPEA